MTPRPRPSVHARNKQEGGIPGAAPVGAKASETGLEKQLHGKREACPNLLTAPAAAGLDLPGAEMGDNLGLQSQRASQGWSPCTGPGTSHRHFPSLGLSGLTYEMGVTGTRHTCMHLNVL